MATTKRLRTLLPWERTSGRQATTDHRIPDVANVHRIRLNLSPATLAELGRIQAMADQGKTSRLREWLSASSLLASAGLLGCWAAGLLSGADERAVGKAVRLDIPAPTVPRGAERPLLYGDYEEDDPVVVELRRQLDVLVLELSGGQQAPAISVTPAGWSRSDRIAGFAALVVVLQLLVQLTATDAAHLIDQVVAAMAHRDTTPMQSPPDSIVISVPDHLSPAFHGAHDERRERGGPTLARARRRRTEG